MAAGPDQPGVDRFKRWATAGLVAIVVAALSLSTGVPGPTGVTHLDKAVHAILYAALAAVLLRALEVTPPFPRMAPPTAAAIAIAYGGALEALQAVVPPRSPEFLDVVANTVGAFVGLAAVLALRVARRRGSEAEPLSGSAGIRR